MSKAVRIGLVGFGNIGAGVVRALSRNGSIIQERVQSPLRLVRIADKDMQTPRETGGFDYSGLLTGDAAAVLEAPDIDIVIELVGGYEPARSFVERALKAGKHVVTANKAILAKFGPELLATARAHQVQLLFEASVGGGIPIIRTLQQGLAANQFNAIYGILNGTANYILTQMAQHATPFDQALKDAQEKGYAEPDPTFDIEGLDTAHKTAILAWLAFGRPTRGEEVYAEGIARVEPEDLRFAARHGYAIKLLGIARRAPACGSGCGGARSGGIELRVHPTLVPVSSLLAAVNDVYNAIMVEGDPIGATMYFGRGAGPDATASAILSDVIALADGMATGGLDRESRLLNACPTASDASPADSICLVPVTEIVGRFYLRFSQDSGKNIGARKKLEKSGIGLEVIECDESNVLQVLT
ncbi:MAG: homoserine dehydrogenase, partial [Candidatus Sumerlaeota bacterium]|nr:homoserine dehydrogenase [Candidatus Sumerlaeota bacterium]